MTAADHGGRGSPDVVGADVVVVLSFHGREDTETCVESLLEGSPEAHVLVVDNGSFDGVIGRVRRRWPEVSTLQTGSNFGFAGGMNRGVRWALQRGAGTITVLNNDTVVPTGVIAALGGIAREGVAVSPEVRYADGTGRVWFGGGTIDRQTGLARHLSDAELAEQDAATRARDRSAASRRPTEILAGCCVTASADTWRRVGPFDERYFLIFEDSDWSVRARRSGIQLVVATDLTILHRVSASLTGAQSYLGLLYYTRNALLFGASLRRFAGVKRLRLLRRHVLPVLGADLRAGDRVDAGRHGLVVLVAVSAHLLRRYGRAPGWLERRAATWAETR